MTEGELYRKICGELRGFAGLYLDEPLYGNSKEIWVILSRVLDEARNSMEKAFNEKEEMWLQFKSAYNGESGDYPDTVDFVIWLYEETEKLLAEKKKWFGSAEEAEK